MGGLCLWAGACQSHLQNLSSQGTLGEGCQDKAKLQEIIQKVKEAWWQERSELEEAVAKIESREQGQRREAVEVAAPPAKKPRRTITKAHPATGAAAEMLSSGIDAPPPSLCNEGDDESPRRN